MPEAHREGGFVVQIYLPPREHGPPHVHVHKGGHHVVIALGGSHSPAFPLRASGMSALDVVRAVRIVEANKSKLVAEWERHHGA